MRHDIGQALYPVYIYVWLGGIVIYLCPKEVIKCQLNGDRHNGHNASLFGFITILLPPYDIYVYRTMSVFWRMEVYLYIHGRKILWMSVTNEEIHFISMPFHSTFKSIHVRFQRWASNISEITLYAKVSIYNNDNAIYSHIHWSICKNVF